MPPDSKASKTCSRLSDLQRKQICEYAEEHPNAKHQDIAEVLNDRNSGLKLERSTITKILKKREIYKSIEESKKQTSLMQYFSRETSDMSIS